MKIMACSAIRFNNNQNQYFDNRIGFHLNRRKGKETKPDRKVQTLIQLDSNNISDSLVSFGC